VKGCQKGQETIDVGFLSQILNRNTKERKEVYLYSAIYCDTLKALRRGSQFYLQMTPRLPFLRERSPDVTTIATAATDIQLQLTTHLPIPKRMKG